MNRISLEAREGLDRLKQSNDAIQKIVWVLIELPDWEMRWSVIDYLHKRMKRAEDSQATKRAEESTV